MKSRHDATFMNSVHETAADNGANSPTIDYTQYFTILYSTCPIMVKILQKLYCIYRQVTSFPKCTGGMNTILTEDILWGGVLMMMVESAYNSLINLPVDDCRDHGI